jgi:predicted phosphodiesterase
VKIDVAFVAVELTQAQPLKYGTKSWFSGMICSLYRLAASGPRPRQVYLSTAALYDIHGNLPALEAVLADVRRAGINRLVIGGDVVPGPMPRECLMLLKSLGIPAAFIRGNGDRVVVAARSTGEVSEEVPPAFHDAIQWNASQLDDDTAAWVDTWPGTLRMSIEPFGEVFFCHATPQNDVDIFTKRTADARLLPLFGELAVSLVVCGHTHMQFDRTLGPMRIVNAGSVGMSFQGQGAYWLEIGETLRLRRTEYDLEGAAARIRATRYPQAEQFARSNVLETPTEPAMLDAFSAAELKSRS